MVTGFSCHPDEEEAKRRGLDGFRFFGFALAHHYIFGKHRIGRTNIWKLYDQIKGFLPDDGRHRGIGTPDQLRAHLRSFADAGVDQVVFIQQGGKNRHEHICESLELFAKQVMPEFTDAEADRERKKMEELAPYLEEAMKRKEWLEPLSEGEIPRVEAFGRSIAETAQGEGPLEAARPFLEKLYEQAD